MPSFVWPSGKLQEAGSMIFRDGSTLGYGRNQDPFEPEYSYVRPVDFCSACGLLVDRQLYLRLGGLDTHWEPSYYEDVDLCMRIRHAGYQVLFKPAAVIIHHEFTSRSLDEIGKLIQENSKKFAIRWNTALKAYPTPNDILLGRDAARRVPVLIIDDQIPVQLAGRGYARSYEMLRILSTKYAVTLFPNMDKTPFQPWLEELQQMGIEIVYNELTLHNFLIKRQGFYSIVIVSRPHNFQKSRESITQLLPNAKIIYDAEALFFKRLAIKNTVLHGTGKNDLGYCQNRERELSLISSVDRIIVVSSMERKSLMDEIPNLKSPVDVWAHALSAMPTQCNFQSRKNILFIGSFVDPGSPNEDAVLYFSQQIFPLIRPKLNCKLCIVGFAPTPAILHLQSEHIEVHGYAPNLDEYYETCKVFVVPHRFAGGISLKLCESMSRGVPSVVTPLIAEQLGLTDQVFIASNPEAFAQRLEEVYSNEQIWMSLRGRGLEFIENNFKPRDLAVRLLDIVEDTMKR